MRATGVPSSGRKKRRQMREQREPVSSSKKGLSLETAKTSGTSQEEDVESSIKLLQDMSSTGLGNGEQYITRQSTSSQVQMANYSSTSDEEYSKIADNLPCFGKDLEDGVRRMIYRREGLVSEASGYTWPDISEETLLALLSENYETPSDLESKSPSETDAAEEPTWIMVDKLNGENSCSSSQRLREGSDQGTTPSPHIGPLLDRLIRPDQHFESSRKLEYEILSSSSVAIYSLKWPKNSNIDYPELPPDLASGMPEAFSDEHITTLCTSPENEESSFYSVNLLYEMRDCRNAIVKAYLNLRRLQQANFCNDYFSLIMVGRYRPVACLRSIKILKIRQFVWQIERIFGL